MTQIVTWRKCLECSKQTGTLPSCMAHIKHDLTFVPLLFCNPSLFVFQIFFINVHCVECPVLSLEVLLQAELVNVHCTLVSGRAQNWVCIFFEDSGNNTYIEDSGYQVGTSGCAYSQRMRAKLARWVQRIWQLGIGRINIWCIGTLVHCYIGTLPHWQLGSKSVGNCCWCAPGRGCTMHFALCTAYYPLCTRHYALCTVHYALCRTG